MIALKILGLLLLAALSVGLSAVEAAFYLTRRRRVAHLAQGNARVEIATRYLADPPTLLMPVHMGTYTAHAAMTVVLASLFMPIGTGEGALLAAFLGMLVHLLLLRLTLPYALVRSHPERALLLLLPAFHLYAHLLGPLVRALRKRAAGEQAAEPLEPVVEVPPAPLHDPNEERLLQAVGRFADTQVKEVMTPRPDIVALPAKSTVADLRRTMRESKYSRLPVYGDNLDDITGVVTGRDLIEFDGKPTDPLAPLVRPAFLVPETKKIADLLREFQSRRATFALVIDEYGGTAGLVTVEDIVEEIVGEIKDEYDVEQEPIVVEPDGAVLVAGRVNLERLEDAIGAELAEGDDVGTVGGLVATAFGRIPRAGDRLNYRGFELEVTDAEHKRVNRVRFRRLPAEVEA